MSSLRIARRLTVIPLNDKALTDWVMKMTPAEEAEMKATWYRYASPAMEDLIDATFDPLAANANERPSFDDLQAQALAEESRLLAFTETVVDRLQANDDAGVMAAYDALFTELAEEAMAEADSLAEYLADFASLTANKTRPGGLDYRWNPNLGSTGRYIGPNGKMVSETNVTKAMEDVIAGVSGEIEAISQKLIDGNLSLQEWYTQMRQKMKTMHSLSAAVAKGGWPQMSQSDWGFVGATSKREYKFLENFAQQIESGEQALTRGVISRAKMYAKAARSTAAEMERREAKQKFEEERRVLGPADHCTTQGGLLGCVELARMGWKPVGTLPRIGESPCRTNCKCKFIYRGDKTPTERPAMPGPAAPDSLPIEDALPPRDGDQFVDPADREKALFGEPENMPGTPVKPPPPDERAEWGAAKYEAERQKMNEAYNELFSQLFDEEEAGLEREAWKEEGISKAEYEERYRQKRWDLQEKQNNVDEEALPYFEQGRKRRERHVGAEIARRELAKIPKRPVDSTYYDELREIAGLLVQDEVDELKAWEADIARKGYDQYPPRIREWMKGNHANIRRAKIAKIRQAQQEAAVLEQKYNRARNNVEAGRRLLSHQPPARTEVDISAGDDHSRREINRAVDGFFRMVGVGGGQHPSVKITFDPKSVDRAYFSPKKNRIFLDESNPETVIHELGHWLEKNNDKVREEGWVFWKSRTVGRATEKLRETFSGAYGEDEVIKEGDFIDLYMGKFYEISRTTEIISMGLQHLWEDPIHFAEQDPDYFNFLYGLLADINMED